MSTVMENKVIETGVSGKPDIASIRDRLERVTDPEIPVLSISDLGVLRDVRIEDDTITVSITPTYSGCPAMTEIRNDIHRTLSEHFDLKVRVITQLSPAWSTEDMTGAGRRALLEYGIAPPGRLNADRRVACPLCGSESTRLVSEFGSTPCKALYQCDECREPFDHFKCI